MSEEALRQVLQMWFGPLAPHAFFPLLSAVCTCFVCLLDCHTHIFMLTHL